MPQTYGLELEMVGLPTSSIREAIETVEEATYVGHFGYHGSRRLGLRHARMDGDVNDCQWVTEEDSSLSCRRTGLTAEIVSPILHGQAGLAHARRIMKAVSRAGGKVNKTCGTHVTMGVNNCSARFRRMGAAAKSRVAGRLLEAYEYFWPAFASLVSESRRDNRYCKRPSLRNGQRFGVAPKSYYASNLRGMHMGKYTAVNISGFSGSGIVEFRMHNGTLNGHKISQWALLHHRLLSWACNTAPVDFRNFTPDFDGLCEMINVNAQLRTQLEARISETSDYESNYFDDRNWTAYRDFQNAQEVA